MEKLTLEHVSPYLPYKCKLMFIKELQMPYTLEFRFTQFVHSREHGHALDHIIKMVDKLRAMHFDLDYLIGKKLAIDINTLNH